MVFIDLTLTYNLYCTEYLSRISPLTTVLLAHVAGMNEHPHKSAPLLQVA